MILCDTNVLVALVDDSDELSPVARAELRYLARRNLFVTEPILTETAYLLPGDAHRQRLAKYLTTVPITLAPALNSDDLYREIFAWLARYAEHMPDWADAHMSVLCGQNRQLRVWTYDREFHTIWRRPDGSRIPVVGKRRS
jgi:predicted nucleic acid-binding protein